MMSDIIHDCPVKTVRINLHMLPSVQSVLADARCAMRENMRRGRWITDEMVGRADDGAPGPMWGKVGASM